MDKWDDRWLRAARFFSEFSEDRSTKVGAVFIGTGQTLLSQGWNGLPRGIENTPDRNDRPKKYDYFCHAEENAIVNAARNGVSLLGSVLYCTNIPCARQCAKMIIQAGTVRVVVPRQCSDGQLTNSLTEDRDGNDRSVSLLQEAGVKFEILEK